MKTKYILGGVVLAAIGLVVLGRIFSGGAPIGGSASVHGGVSGVNVSSDTVAPDFSLQKLGGGTITLSEFKDKKPVVVDFWASWCPNCRRDMPVLNRLYEKYKDKIEVIGVNLQERESVVRNFIDSRGINFPVALDPGGRASRAYGIRYTNSHLLISKSGNLARVIPGDIRESDILSIIEDDNASAN